MSLCPAVANGNVELVRDLLACGADPNQLGSYMGQCAIEWAMHMLKKMKRSKDYDAVRNIFACVEICLDAGALPDGPPTDSRNNPTFRRPPSPRSRGPRRPIPTRTPKHDTQLLTMGSGEMSPAADIDRRPQTPSPRRRASQLAT